MLNQSFRQVFVTNTPTLLASGSTVENLAVGQVAIVDAKSYRATTTPTYATNKALYLVHGTPDLSHLPFMYGAPNQNEYSKLIKGKLLTNFRGKAAKRGQAEAWVLGFSGDPTDTNTLFAKPGEKKTINLTLTGEFITKLYSPQGITRQYAVKTDVADDCGDPCINVDCNLLVNDLVNQINSDKTINKFVKASPIIDCTPDLPVGVTNSDFEYILRVVDTKDAVALGNVQVQYPNDRVERIAIEGLTSVYRVVRDTAVLPAAFSTGTTTLINDCDVCPTGYTLVPSGFAYQVTRNDAGDAAAKTAVNTAYGLGGSEVNNRTSYNFGQSTYVIVSTTPIASPAAGDTLQFLGEARSSCVLTTPTTVAWVAGKTLTRFGKAYRIIVADDICGNDRLTDIQAAYPGLVVTMVAGSVGDCVHTYETTILSNAVDAASCTPDQLKFTKPQSFEGIEWVAVPAPALPNGTTCRCGIRFDLAYVNRTTNECTFDAFPYDADTVHMTVSEFNPEYNYGVDGEQWVARKIQGFQMSIGNGGYIQRLEKDSLMYALRHRSTDAVVREFEKFEFQAQQGKFYDEYVLEFDFQYKVGGWADTYTDSYHLHVYFPEGQGKAFETAINNYITSAHIAIDPVVL